MMRRIETLQRQETRQNYDVLKGSGKLTEKTTPDRSVSPADDSLSSDSGKELDTGEGFTELLTETACSFVGEIPWWRGGACNRKSTLG